MFFNSFQFFIFFVLVFAGYSFLKQKGQNRLLLAASYFFYGAWDVRFLGLLATTTIIDYSMALAISQSSAGKRKKLFLTVSVGANLLILGFFKYFNFFTESSIALINAIGFSLSPVTLHIILPVGISFYTFQSMSYTIDVFRGEVPATKRFFDYALYVSFFPQLVAGPIERASHLLPQVLLPRSVTFAKIQLGFYYVFWGLFLKVFVADNLGRVVDPVFSASGPQTGWVYLLAGYGFAFQIFGDFAGYSNIAKGVGLILGFDIMDNFNLPYFAGNPQEFWRRWHISLSTWLRDYLYIPLSGNRGGLAKTTRNLFITMLLGGLWHGAQITFVLWGFVHGVLLAAHYLFRQVMPRISITNSPIKAVSDLLKIFCFFHIIVLTWFFFRANSLDQLSAIFIALFTNFHFDLAGHQLLIKKLIFYIFPLLLIQFMQAYHKNLLATLQLPILIRSTVYVALFYLIVIFGVNNAQDFIYFQF